MRPVFGPPARPGFAARMFRSRSSTGARDGDASSPLNSTTPPSLSRPSIGVTANLPEATMTGDHGSIAGHGLAPTRTPVARPWLPSRTPSWTAGPQTGS